MPIRFKSVKMMKTPGQPFGIKSVELPLGAGILVTGTTRSETAEILTEGNRIVGVNGRPVRNLKQMMEFLVGPPLNSSTLLLTIITPEPLGDEITINIGEHRDFDIDEELYVTEIYEEESPLMEGDHIFMINSLEVPSRKELLATIKAAPKGDLNVMVWRERLGPWEHEFQRRDGFDYLAVEFAYPEAPDRPKGYIVSFLQGQLLITKFLSRSPAQKKLALMDRIIFVNDVPVSDMAQVRTEITTAGEKDGKYTLVVERPLTLKGYKEIIEFFKTPVAEKKVESTLYFDAEPASDIKSLARIAKEQRDAAPAPKPLFRSPNAVRNQPRLRIKSQHKSLLISRDTPVGKRLRPVRPRYS